MGHFDPLVLLRVKSSAGWRHLIFNDLEALQVESGGHFGQLIFTEWAYRITGKTEILKMITPVASLRLKSSYGKRNLILDDSPNSHCGGFGSERLGVTVKWYFPKWEAPLYRMKQHSLYADGSLSADRHCCNIWHLPESVRTAPRSKRRYTFLAQRAF